MRRVFFGWTVCAVAALSGCFTPLQKAARSNDVAQIKALAAAGADLNRHTAFNGMPPLMLAVYLDKKEAARALIESGATIDAPSSIGRTALVLALYKGNVVMARELLAKGADPLVARSYMQRSAILKRRYASALAMLDALQRERETGEHQQTALSRRDIQEIVQATVQGSKPQGQAQNAAASDIDTPRRQLAERPDDFAVVVGIRKYSEVPEAQFADNDAAAVERHLLALGLPRRNVIHLADEKAGYKGIEKYVETWLPRNVKEDGRVFFYFSGHGAPDPKTGEAYLIPWDGDPNFLDTTGYPIKRLYEKLSALKAKEIVVAMDACFSGAGGRSVLAKGARPLVMRLESAAVPQNLTVFAAASADQITSTLEDQGHGSFTYYFLKGLSGAAMDGSGRVTSKALFDYLKPKVQDAARTQNREQDPVLQGAGDTELAKY